MRKSTSGFTIVELLIVVVVIAILAAISVVAYTGIQNRAKYAQQISELDKIGKAIQLYRAETGGSLWGSGSGSSGDGYGSIYATSANGTNYTELSIHALLESTGYLPNFSQTLAQNAGISNILLTPCTSSRLDFRWVIVSRLIPAPPMTVDDQVSQSGCNHSLITLYTDRDPGVNSNYGGNFIKAY